MRELNRLGVTSAIDAGGGFQNYPDDYQVIEELHRRGEMTVRIAYNLFTQRPKQELDDFAKWVKMTRPGEGSDFYRMNGAGEMLVFSAADFEDFLEPRPDLPGTLEQELTPVVRLLAEHRWPFRLHATYDESIARFLDVFEAVNREVPFDGLRWFFDHAETVTERNLERIKALGGGIAVQHRMAYQGEYFIDRYGHEAAAHTPPIGEDAGAWASRSGRAPTPRAWRATTRGCRCTGWSRARRSAARPLYPEANRLDRGEALRRYTHGQCLVLRRGGQEGRPSPSASWRTWRCLSADYFSVPEEEIKGIESVLTRRGRQGRVRGRATSPALAPPPLPVLPDWSPVKAYGGYFATAGAARGRPRPGLCAYVRSPQTYEPGIGRKSGAWARAVVGPGLRVFCVLIAREELRGPLRGEADAPCCWPARLTSSRARSLRPIHRPRGPLLHCVASLQVLTSATAGGIHETYPLRSCFSPSPC